MTAARHRRIARVRSAAPRLLLVVAAALLLALALNAGPVAAAPPPPQLSAPAAAVVEVSTGRQVFGRAARERRMIASTTKIMTALVTVAALRPDRVCTAPPYPASPVESQIGLRAGERMTVADLLRGLILPSGNDAAATLAVCAAGSREAFVARMNRRARALGLKHTRFATPVGLDVAGNYSTAADLARLAIEARRDPFLRRTMDLGSAVLRSGDRPRPIVNRNTLVRTVPWVDGVKTGHTNGAGYVLVASGTRGGLSFVATVLGDPSEAARDADALALLRWAFASYRIARPVERGEVLARPRVKHREEERIDVVAARSVRELVRRDARVRVAVDAPDELQGPLPARSVVGTLTVRAGGRAIARVPLVTRQAVPEVGLLERAGGAVAGPGSLIAIVAIVGGAVILVLVRRRHASRRRHRRRADMEAA